MRQVIFFTFHLLLLVFTVSLQGQHVSEVAGSWLGFIDIDGQELPINLTFSYSDEILDGTIDIPDQGAFTMPVEVIDTSEGKLVFQFETGNGPAVFYGVLDEDSDEISGEFNQFGEIHTFYITRDRFADVLFSGMPESEVIIPTTGDGQISGSLILREERSPLVILVSGSGSENRDLNIGGFETFQELANNLYDEGYSSFRYDDPGTGESAGEADVTLPEMSADLMKIIEYLRNQNAENISGVVLLGHNQGGLVASMAADKSSVDAVILAATPFIPAEKIITQQIQKISEAREIPDKVVQQNLEFQNKVYDVVRAGTGWAEIESELAKRLEQQIGELPVEHQTALGDMSTFIQSQVDSQLETAKSRWFKSWIETDPVDVISEMEIPALAVFGEKDTQVLLASNKEVADSLASGPDILLQSLVIPEANHLFQKANTGMPMEYGLLDPEFADEFIQEIDQFLDSIQFSEPG